MLVDFYHLSATPLERALPQICEKLLQQGQRLLIVGEPSLLALLDDQLWGYSREAFLPHGRSDAPSAADQPMLLSSDAVALNGARNIALVDGQWRDEALAFDRAFYFFDDDRREAAREVWRSLKARAGVESRYWRQDERGRWQQGP